MIRPLAIRLVVMLWVLTLVMPTGCQPAPLLTNVRVSQPIVTPNGDGKDDFVYVHYTVNENARVSIVLEGGGHRYVLHDRLSRTPGTYAFKFDGTYQPETGRDERRVLANGDYTIRVIAETADGRQVEQTSAIGIRDADPVPLEITNLTVSPATISPNGDGENDEASIGYGISKDATVSVYVIDGNGNRRVIDPAKPRPAALYTTYWNGKVGNTLLPDGRYDVHVRAADQSGNVTEAIATVDIEGGGTPELAITHVDFSPKALPVGGILNVTIRVKNIGNTPIKTQGPPPGTPYATDTNYMSFTEKRADGKSVPLYYDLPGLLRVFVKLMQADRPYPVRWGLTPDLSPLLPGQEATITGTIEIKLDETSELEFWAGVEQGGVGFPGGEKGRQKIRISY